MRGSHISQEIRDIALHDPSVATTLAIVERGGLSYYKALEALVVVLVKQKKELMNQCIKDEESRISRGPVLG